MRKGGGSFGAKLVYVANESDEYTTKLANLFADEAHQRKPRSYAGDRRRQVLRWLATYLLNKFGGVEIQCYEDTDGVIYVSSNLNSVNNAMILAQNRGALFPAFAAPTLPMSKERVARHVWKTGRLAPAKNDDEVRLKNRITQFGVVVIPEDKDVVAGYHAERRIRKHLGKVLDSARLAGTRRACMTCATTLDLPKEAYPGILYTTSAGLGGVSIEEVQNVAEQRELRSHITKNRVGSLTDGYGTDSEDDAY